MSKGHDHTEQFRGDVNIFLIGANSWCKCLVGNKILGFEHFLPEQSTFAEEVSLQIGVRWITVIQEPQAVIQRYVETSSTCMILFVLQRDHVSQRDMETLVDFQQKFGKKMEENTVVVLVSREDKTSVRLNKGTDEKLDSILYQCGRKVCVFNKKLEQRDLIKQLITCCKSMPELQVYKHERSLHRTASVEWEICNPQEAMTQEHIPGDNQAAIKKKNTLTIVLLGQTGSGKSATGNTILRNRHFESRASSVPVTQVCQMAEETVCGIKIRVIDTPDFFDEDLKHQEEQIKNCKELWQPGPDVYLLVMELGRYTDGERAIVTNIQREFGADVVKETIVLFTRKEKLRGKTVSEYIKNAETQLQELIQTCGSRCHAFNNNDQNVSQFKRLLEMILEMKRKNGNPDFLEHYSYSKESEKKDCRIQ